MDFLPPPAEDTACPHGVIPATPFDQLNFACEAITDQLLHVVISFDGRLREDTLGQALKGAIHCCPILGSRFRDANRPFWDPLPTLHPEELLYLHKTDDPDRMLRQVMVAPIDVTRTAPIRLDLIRAGTDTLCITHHHAAGDARGILDCTRLSHTCTGTRGRRGMAGRFPGVGERTAATAGIFLCSTRRQPSRRISGPPRSRRRTSSPSGPVPVMPGTSPPGPFPRHTWNGSVATGKHGP